ncbi:MAG: nitroreductase family protein [Thermomicrobiales bacterium]|nr:nitroreductase family protein [Thermomicrobiales bacterium]
MSDLSLHDIIRKRRMTRNFTEEPVAWEVVERIVDNARRGPSAGYSQGMAFVAVTDDAMRARLAEIAGEEWYVKSGHEPFMSRAPIHLIVTANESIYHQRYNEPDKKAKGQEEIGWPIPYWHTDAGAAMMLVLLSAVDEGWARRLSASRTPPRSSRRWVCRMRNCRSVSSSSATPRRMCRAVH